jgi:adenylate cyclase
VAETRRLAAIMFTDMVGYTAATQADEKATLALRQEQEELIRPVLAAHHGREVKSTGDGFLVEFESALKATECAISIQRRLHERNARSGVTPIGLRIGIHLGDVEQQGTDIFGDAVNIASRIEPIAEPGGICLSGAVYEQVRNKIPDKLEKLPPKELKGLQVSMDLFRVVLPWTVREIPSTRNGPARVAVLPFTNMSPDPADAYFADGLTEELITVLSQLRELRVIARTSVMQYKSSTKAVSQIGSELGVSSILEGSVRRAGNRLRITAQLIDVDSQEHVWAKSYDRELDDVFVVQAEIAKQVADALKIELGPTEAARLEAGSAVRPESYLAYLKGRALLHTPSRASTEAARKQFEVAISLDTRNAAAYSGLADATSMMGWWYPGEQPYEVWHEAARRFVTHALELDPNLAEAHASLAMVLWSGYGRDYPAIEREFGLALSLNPSYAIARRMYAGVLQDEGRIDEAMAQLSLAEVADPLFAQNLTALALALLWRGRFDEAWTKIQKVGQLDPLLPAYHGVLARYHLARGNVGEAIEEAKRTEQLLSAEPTLGKLYRAWYLALSGENEQSREILQAEESSPISVLTVGFTIGVYAELGDVDACYRWMEKARGVLSVQGLRVDPRLEPIRHDRRFAPFLKKIGLVKLPLDGPPS